MGETQDGFCGQCGTKNPLTSIFCFKCGQKLLWAAQEAAPLPVEVASQVFEENETAKIPPALPNPEQRYISQPIDNRKPNPKTGIRILVGILAVVCFFSVIAQEEGSKSVATVPQSVKAHVIASQKQQAAQRLAREKFLHAQRIAQKARDAHVAQQQKQAQIIQAKLDETQAAAREKEDAKFGGVLKVINLGFGMDMVRFSGTEDNGSKVIIQVDDAWHSINKQVRLERTQLMGNAWGSIHKEIKIPRISIRDEEGNEVGGFSDFSGFWVQD